MKGRIHSFFAGGTVDGPGISGGGALGSLSGQSDCGTATAVCSMFTNESRRSSRKLRGSFGKVH